MSYFNKKDTDRMYVVYSNVIELCAMIGGARGLYYGYQSTKCEVRTLGYDTITVTIYGIVGSAFGVLVGFSSPIAIPVAICLAAKKIKNEL
jgi:hypothetical protein